MLLPIKAPSVCPSCSRPISTGEMVSWSSGSPAIHATCELRAFEAQTHEARVDNWRSYKAKRSFALPPSELPVTEFDIVSSGEVVGTMLAIGTEEAENFLKKRIRALAYPANTVLLPKL
jgi:hypothetical protein